MILNLVCAALTEKKTYFKMLKDKYAQTIFFYFMLNLNQWLC